MRYSSTAVDFPIATDVSQSIRASYTTFSSRTCVPVCARTRRHYKNDTLTIQIMVQFTLVFTTRHRNEDAVEKDCKRICESVVEFTTRYEYVYNGKELIVFHIFEPSREIRLKILFAIIGSLQLDTKFKSLDLQSYTKD